MNSLDPHQVEDSLDRFLREVRPRLRAVFARYRIPPQDTEDILQQSLLTLVYQWERVQDPEAWLIGTIRNKCLVYWRDRHRSLLEAMDSSALEWVAKPEAPSQHRKDLWKDLETLIGRLPRRCQTLLWMRYRMGYDSAEIAEHLGYSRASVSKTASRCLEALIRELNNADGPEQE